MSPHNHTHMECIKSCLEYSIIYIVSNGRNTSFYIFFKWLEWDTKHQRKAFDSFHSFRRMILGKYIFNLNLIHLNDDRKTILNKVI